MQTMHLSDTGTVISMQVLEKGEIVNLSAGSAEIVFRKPNGSCVAKTATFFTDGSDGMIQYIVESGFIDQAGKWSMQAVVSIGDGEWRSDPVWFSVSPNVCTPEEPE